MTAWKLLRRVFILSLLLAGCASAKPLPSDAQDWSDLQSRFDKLQPGMSQKEVAGVLGDKGGGPLVGFATETTARKPAARDIQSGDESKFWVSIDRKGWICVTFSDDDKGGKVAKSIELTRIGEPSGPVERPQRPDGPGR